MKGKGRGVKTNPPIKFAATPDTGGRHHNFNPPISTQKAGVYVKPGQQKPRGQGTVPKNAGGKGGAMAGAALRRPPVSF